MNGIFGAGPADQDYEQELDDSAKRWEPTFSQRAIAQQWGLEPPQAQAQAQAQTQAPQQQLVVRSAARPVEPGLLPIASAKPRQPLVMRPAVKKKPQAGFAIPKWLPWTLALAGVGALVYVLAKKPTASKLEAPTI